MEKRERKRLTDSGARRGRPPNSTNILSKQAREQAILTGALPHEILLSMARGEPQLVKEIDEHGQIKEHYEAMSLEARRDAAKAAAPYFAPKISTVEVISGVGDHDLDQLIAQLAAEAGVSVGPSRTGTQEEDSTSAADGA